MERVEQLVEYLKIALQEAERQAEIELRALQAASEKNEKAQALVSNIQRSIEALRDLVTGNVKWMDY